jgi:uracil-DNA glycosylase
MPHTAETLGELFRASTSSFRDCTLCKESKYGQEPLPGVGSPEARICFLGRNPGSTEDELRRPFCGRAGKKLDEGLLHAGLSRAGYVDTACWITNTAKCMTPGDLKPSRKCYTTCIYAWLNKEMALLKRLELIVALGNEALHYLEPHGSVGELQGQLLTVKRPWCAESEIKVFASYHPSAAMRTILVNRLFIASMKKLGEYIRNEKLV